MVKKHMIIKRTALILNILFLPLIFCLSNAQAKAANDSSGTEKEVTLRICNWEEYIDLGGWEDDDVIDLESGDIFGENSMIEDFEHWYLETFGVKVNVVYSTFGTNEDLYNMLTLGDVYDLVCPSEYMIMKLISEDALVPLSDGFFDREDKNNYYISGVSPYLQSILETQEINGEPWSRYMAGYMWGITGIVYNPEVVSAEDASTWAILNNPEYKRRVTVKDNVRDSYFAAVAAVKSSLLRSDEFTGDPGYAENLEEEMNDVSKETMAAAEKFLQSVKDNAYSFETDSGKADMITGKVVANYQWSGDAVYTMDQAEEDGYMLNFAVPEECSNIYFDGWVMLKSGIGQDEEKQRAAEAFINFCSRPDNAVRNMYYIGYTSFISAADDGRIFEYADWCYGADETNEDAVEYSLSYFFAGENDDENYVLTVPAEQIGRQLKAQYPSVEEIKRTAIMRYFDPETNEAVNEMWIHVRCFNAANIPKFARAVAFIAACAAVMLIIYKKGRRKA